MRLGRFALILLTTFALAGGAAYFLSQDHLPAPGPMEGLAQSLVQTVADKTPGPAAATSVEGSGAMPSSTPKGETPIDREGRDAVARCFEALETRERGSEPETLEAVVEAAERASGAPMRWEDDSRTVRLATSEGERRLHVEHGESPSLEWSGLDAEGQWTALPIPAEDEHDPSDEAVARYLARGKILDDERTRVGSSPRASQSEGISATLTVRNGRLAGFDLWINGRTLSCEPGEGESRAACRCAEN